MTLIRLLLLTVAASAATTALAHTELSESFPADHAMLESAPEAVKLKFSEPVRLTALAVQLDGAAKRNLGPLPTDSATQFSLALPALQDGHYVVSWRALSEDTHVMTGEFMFAVGATGDHAAPMNHDVDADHGAQAGAASHDEHAGSH